MLDIPQNKGTGLLWNSLHELFPYKALTKILHYITLFVTIYYDSYWHCSGFSKAFISTVGHNEWIFLQGQCSNKLIELVETPVLLHLADIFQANSI